MGSAGKTSESMALVLTETSMLYGILAHSEAPFCLIMFL